MQCIYFSQGSCYANPSVQLPEFFKPDEDDQKNFCKTERFNNCPRFASTKSQQGTGSGGQGGGGSGSSVKS